MKNINQLKFEAMQRKKEIARKTKKLGLNESGNIQSGIVRNTRERLEAKGFYIKGEKSEPTPLSLSEKRLNKNVIDIIIVKR
jgi:hypothetical protein